MAAINLNASTPTMVDLSSSAAAEFDPDQLFTCLSCSVAFLSPDEQREHMRSDWHRYNMKRRVATLPPVTAALFNRKVIERRNENAVTATKQGETCTLCAKSFASQGAYRTHVESKKHRDAELKEATRLLRGALLTSSSEQPSTEAPTSGEVPSFDPTSSAANSSTAPKDKPTPAPFVQPTTTNLIPSYDSYASVHTPNQPLHDSDDPTASSSSAASTSAAAAAPSLAIPEDADEETIQSTIDARIAFARTRLTPTSCLFCSHKPFATSEDAISHMQLAHGFFIPDREYLVDLPGLILYLSEKVAIGNVCLYCNGKGKEYKSMEAVRKHMVDKSHCKIAYSSEPERMEFSDYYDFSSSYSNPKPRRTRHRKHKKEKLAAVDEEWEDAEDVGSDAEEEEEEVIEEGSSSKMDQDNDDDDESDDGTSSDGSGTSYTETDDSLSDSDAPGVTFDPESMELVLPSGRRIGHRSLQRYYDQRPSTHTHAGALELVPTHRRSIKDKTDLALVSAKGGFGDKGRGGEVMRARNKGEAKNAAKNPYKAMQTREKFKMRVGSTSGNNMKHFRDPLLQ